MNILTQFFEKKGIDPSKLSSEEKATLEQWKSTFAQADKDVTVKDISQFCDKELKRIEELFRDFDTPKDKLERNVVAHSVYTSIRNMIELPKDQREQFEKYLETLL